MTAIGDARRARLGPKAVAAAQAAARNAPAPTAEQFAALVLLLRRDRPVRPTGMQAQASDVA